MVVQRQARAAPSNLILLCVDLKPQRTKLPRGHGLGFPRAFRATRPWKRRGGGDLGHVVLQTGVLLVRQLLPMLTREFMAGRIRAKPFAIAVGLCGLVILVSVYEFGGSDTMSLLHGAPIDLSYLSEASEEERDAALAGLKGVEEELRLLGPMTVMAGTQCPQYWTSSQTLTNPNKEYECVRLQDPLLLTSLQLCLAGHDIGAGGRDAGGKNDYKRLELAYAWRVENRTLWGKFAAERQQTLATMEGLRDPRIRFCDLYVYAMAKRGVRAREGWRGPMGDGDGGKGRGGWGLQGGVGIGRREEKRGGGGGSRDGWRWAVVRERCDHLQSCKHMRKSGTHQRVRRTRKQARDGAST